MLCFYCGSTFHKSKKCPVYVSKEFREQIRLKKMCCGFSFRRDFHERWCINKEGPKCYICFVKDEHETYDCPQKFENPKWFLPSIDHMLLFRFFKLFDNIELFSFVRYCREALHYATLEPFKILNKFDEDILEKHKDSIIVLICNSETTKISEWRKIYNSKNVFLKVKSLYHFNSECSAEDLFRNFSPITKVLGLRELKVTPKIQLYDILIKLPNLNEIILVDTNIEIPNDWPQKILKYCEGTFDSIILRIDNFNFNIDDLVTIMTTKSTENVGIGLQIEKPNVRDKKWLAFKLKLLSKHFIQIKEKDPELPCLSFFYMNNLKQTILAFFTLKIFQDLIEEENLYCD